MFFTLERVDNGYILSYKETGDTIKQNTSHKEVITEDKISTRIGQLLKLDTMKKLMPIVFHVEVVSESIYKESSDTSYENNIEVKLAFYNFKKRDIAPNDLLVLHLADDDSVNIYGPEAELFAKTINMKCARVGKVPVLQFNNSKEGKKIVSQSSRRVNWVEADEETIRKWNDNHQIK